MKIHEDLSFAWKCMFWPWITKHRILIFFQNNMIRSTTKTNSTDFLILFYKYLTNVTFLICMYYQF